VHHFWLISSKNPHARGVIRNSRPLNRPNHYPDPNQRQQFSTKG